MSWLFLALATQVSWAQPAIAETPLREAVDVRSYGIKTFKIGVDDNQFGPFRFIGGFSMTSSNRNFGALSSFRFQGEGRDFVSVADTGFLVTGRVHRDDMGAPIGWTDVVFQPLPDSEGGYSDRKWEMDAESIEIDGNRLTIGFERAHRLSEFTFADGALSPEVRRLDFKVPAHELRGNRGFEALARAPISGALEGARVAIAEKSLDKAGNIFGAIVEGPKTGIFTVARRDDFDVTDADFLPNGDLLLLERSYRISTGVKMRVRHIAANNITPSAILDGPIVLNADMGFQIDNMEGMDVFAMPDGSMRLALISDDNKSILQRNLYLEFAIDADLAR